MPDQPKLDRILTTDAQPSGCAASAMVVGGVLAGLLGGVIAMSFTFLSMYAEQYGPSPGAAPALPYVICYFIAGISAMLITAMWMVRISRPGRYPRFFAIGFLMGLCLAGLLDGTCFLVAKS